MLQTKRPGTVAGQSLEALIQVKQVFGGMGSQVGLQDSYFGNGVGRQTALGQNGVEADTSFRRVLLLQKRGGLDAKSCRLQGISSQMRGHTRMGCPPKEADLFDIEAGQGGAYVKTKVVIPGNVTAENGVHIVEKAQGYHALLAGQMGDRSLPDQLPPEIQIQEFFSRCRKEADPPGP